MSEQIADIRFKMTFKDNKKWEPIQGESQRWTKWVSSPVEGTCKECAENNGKIRPLDYHWPIEPPVHKNCRCEIKPLETIQAGTGTTSGLMGVDWHLLMTGKLPDNYITEEKARSFGWPAGREIGGDIYSNTDGKLPDSAGRIWYQASINSNSVLGENHYIVYSNDGLVFVTYDGFDSFFEMVDEAKEKPVIDSYSLAKTNPQTGDAGLSAVVVDGWTSLNDYLKKFAGDDYKIIYLNDSDSGSDAMNLLLEYGGKKYVLGYEYKNGALAVEYDKIKGIVFDEGPGDEIIIPEKVVGNINGKEVILYPTESWGYAGKGNYPTGVQKDSNGRYKVAVGPKVINPSYPDDGKIWDGYDGLEKGIEIDVVLKSKITGEQVIIGCVVVDYKAHTYNNYPNGHKNDSLGNAYFDVENGLLQTGISYPNSWNAGQNSALAPANASGNVIEFAGHEVDFKTDDYTLVKIIVKG